MLASVRGFAIPNLRFNFDFVEDKEKRPKPMVWTYFLAPEVGFEPTTLRLTVECSTVELLRNKGV